MKIYERLSYIIILTLILLISAHINLHPYCNAHDITIQKKNTKNTIFFFLYTVDSDPRTRVSAQKNIHDFRSLQKIEEA